MYGLQYVGGSWEHGNSPGHCNGVASEPYFFKWRSFGRLLRTRASCVQWVSALRLDAD